MVTKKYSIRLYLFDVIGKSSQIYVEDFIPENRLYEQIAECQEYANDLFDKCSPQHCHMIVGESLV